MGMGAFFWQSHCALQRGSQSTDIYSVTQAGHVCQPSLASLDYATWGFHVAWYSINLLRLSSFLEG
eukprot:6461340-Amphidinium_carterae.1